MRPAIKTATDALNIAVKGLRSVLAYEQRACRHPRVIHSKWRSSDWGSPFKARRLCLDCGLEEEAKNSGWGDSDLDFKHLKTGGFHKVVCGDEIYRSRFPEGEVDGPVAPVAAPTSDEAAV